MIASSKGLKDLIRHPSAPLAGIIGTFGLSLLAFLPAADEYSAIHAQRLETELLVQRCQQYQSELPRKRETKAELLALLQRENERGVNEEQAHRLRQELVRFSRVSGCQLRRIELGQVRLRNWHEQDHPIQPVSVEKRGKKTGYILELRELRLTLTGEMHEVEQFLKRLESLDVLTNVEQVAIRAVDASGSQVQLELSLDLFGIHHSSESNSLES